MNYGLYGAAVAAMTRVISGEMRIEGSMRAVMESMVETLDELEQTVGDLSVERPASWGRFARRLLQRALNVSDAQNCKEWLQAWGYTRCEDRLPVVWNEVGRRAPIREVYRDGARAIWQVALGDEAFFLEHEAGCAINAESWRRYHVNPEVWLPDDRGHCRRVFARVADFFWSGRDAVLMDFFDDTQRFTDVELRGSRYIGPHENLFSVWNDYREAGLRRAVLLQGKPGTGKSTFVLEAARRLSRRTVLFTPDTVGELSVSDWDLLLEALAPEMVVVDDVDRISDYTLETSLRLFEEGYCDVPFIFFTSNDHRKLPQPLRRPGRIDQILQVDEPDA